MRSAIHRRSNSPRGEMGQQLLGDLIYGKPSVKWLMSRFDMHKKTATLWLCGKKTNSFLLWTLLIGIAETKPRQYLRQGAKSNHLPQLRTETNSGASTKRYIGVFGYTAFVITHKTFGAVSFRVRKILRVFMYHIWTDQNKRALRNDIPTGQDILSDSLAPE